MELHTFIVEMTRALAWPIAILIVASIFRREIAALFARLETLALGNTKATFRPALARVVSLAKQSAKTPEDKATVQSVIQNLTLRGILAEALDVSKTTLRSETSENDTNSKAETDQGP